ncbi:MAG: YitT family protein [Anaerolineae bacterium]
MAQDETDQKKAGWAAAALAQLRRNIAEQGVGLLWDYAQITLGAAAIALGYNLFFVQNEVVSGGISGLGVIANHLFGWPVGVVTFVLNLPLFLAGLRWGGGITTGVRTLYGVIVLSLALDLTAPLVPTVTENPLLVVMYGGLLDGLGVGLVLRARGTTGGTDIIGRLARHFLGVPISRAVFVSNALIIALAALVFGLEKALYGVLVAGVSAWAVDVVLSGGRSTRQVIVISNRWERLRDAIFETLDRGVTIVPGMGAYTGASRPLLICVISRSEIASLRHLVKTIDPQAFVIVSAATEVWGEGFTSIHDELV